MVNVIRDAEKVLASINYKLNVKKVKQPKIGPLTYYIKRYKKGKKILMKISGLLNRAMNFAQDIFMMSSGEWLNTQ